MRMMEKMVMARRRRKERERSQMMHLRRTARRSIKITCRQIVFGKKKDIFAAV